MNTAAAQSDDFFGQSGSTTAFAIPIDKALAGRATRSRPASDSDTVHVGERGILGVQVRNVIAERHRVTGRFGCGHRRGPDRRTGRLRRPRRGRRHHLDRRQDRHQRLGPDDDDVHVPPGDRVDVGWVDQSGAQHHDTLKLVAGPPSYRAGPGASGGPEGHRPSHGMAPSQARPEPARATPPGDRGPDLPPESRSASIRLRSRAFRTRSARRARRGCRPRRPCSGGGRKNQPIASGAHSGAGDRAHLHPQEERVRGSARWSRRTRRAEEPRDHRLPVAVQ